MASPLRIIYDNAADRATLSSTGVSVLPITNLKTNSKSEVWRTSATTTSVTITATSTSPEIVNMVSFPFCNFSSTATIRVKLYSDTACTTLLHDTVTPALCSQGGGGKVRGLTLQQSASAYSHGGGVYATAYFQTTPNVQGVQILVADSANLQGYLEAARLVLGSYFEPMYSAEYGASVEFSDTTVNYRTDAGNLLSDVGTRHKLLSLVLSFMQPSDRANLWKIVKATGLSEPVWLSLYPNSTDKGLEQEHTVYGKFTKMSVITSSNYQIFSAPLEIESL
jgi:hypothetical protein